jgi:radical SAM protein with 4Fe4S-binding SPASM domain
MDDDEYKLGNILVNDFSEIRGSAKVKKLLVQNTQRITEHKKCKRLVACRGACPFYSLLNDPTCTNQEETCANASFIKHIYERVKTE